MRTQIRPGRTGIDDLVESVAALIGQKMRLGFKHDASGVPTTTGYMHGPGGLLSYPGVDPDVFSTIVGPVGLLSSLPTKPSIYTNPTYETITGVTADGVRAGTAIEPEAPCDDAPQAGQRKGCITWAPFGLIKRGTRELEINRMGQANDRADPMDLQLVGNPLGDNLFGSVNGGFNFTQQSLVNELTARFQDRAMAMHLKLAEMLWTGTPANNNAGGGYKEFVGLERLVTTGYVDAQTNQSCPSLDSDVKDFNHLDVADNGDGLVNALTYMLRYVRSLATKSGVLPVRWVFALREELFYEVTKVWPCAYFLGGCTVIDANGQRVNVSATDQIDLRDQMRQGRFLLIDGMKIDVVFDDAIPYDDGNDGVTPRGCFESDIYLLPMSVAGRSTLFLEYFQYNNPSINSVLGLPVLARVDGAFLETPRQTNQCVVFDVKIEPRLVLRTPWLAGRLTNVKYCPLQQVRTAFPGDPYHVDGGVQTRTGPSLYKPTPWLS